MESSREKFLPKIGTIIVTLVCLFTTIMQTSTYFNTQYIYFNPKSSYLYEGKTLTVKVVTEAMQCTEDGKAEWQIVDTQSIGG